MLAMALLSHKEAQASTAHLPLKSSRWSAPRCLGFEREERHESCGTACSPPDASPSRGKALSLHREPLLPSSMLFFILCPTTTC